MINSLKKSRDQIFAILFVFRSSNLLTVYAVNMASSEKESAKSEQDISQTKCAVESQFTKKYSLPTYIQDGKECDYRSSCCCKNKVCQKLPQASKWFHKTNQKWTDAKLASMRADLNSTKALLNDMPLKDWHRHTRFRNPAADVIGRVRSVGDKPELLTQVGSRALEK